MAERAKTVATCIASCMIVYMPLMISVVIAEVDIPMPASSIVEALRRSMLAMCWLEPSPLSCSKRGKVADQFDVGLGALCV